MIEPTRTLSLEEDRILLNISNTNASCNSIKEEEAGRYSKIYREEKQTYKKNEISFIQKKGTNPTLKLFALFFFFFYSFTDLLIFLYILFL